MNTNLAQITTHPTDPNTVVLHTPPGLATEMGRFEPARYDAARRAYLVHTDHLPALHRFAATIGLHLIDERARPAGDRPLMPECTGCGQPAKATARLSRCPACGQAWRPRYVDPGTGHGEHTRQTCPNCGHTQRGRFDYCANCGTAIPPEPSHPKPALPRRKLRDPLPLAQTIPDTEKALRATEEGTDEPPF